MAGRYNTWLRAKLADRIRENGGYHQRHASHALSWRVRYHGHWELDADKAADTLIECGHFDNLVDLTLQFPDFEDRFNMMSTTDRYNHATERLHDDLKEDEGMRMWSPETAKRYGFDYKGRGADVPFHMNLAGYGRGGKHVCLTHFEHEDLELDNNELADLIDPAVEKDVNYDRCLPNSWCRKLMGIMDELDETLTDENAERCGLYYETDEIARGLGLFD